MSVTKPGLWQCSLEQQLGNELEVTADSHVVLMSHVSVTISYLFCCLTIETKKHVNENSFKENSALLKYFICEHRE